MTDQERREERKRHIVLVRTVREFRRLRIEWVESTTARETRHLEDRMAEVMTKMFELAAQL